MSFARHRTDGDVRVVLTAGFWQQAAAWGMFNTSKVESLLRKTKDDAVIRPVDRRPRPVVGPVAEAVLP